MKQISLSLLVLLTGSSLASGGVHWGYDGSEGPENWGKLSPEFALCSTGKSQSPINITATIDADLPALGLNYGWKVSEIINNGHTIQVNAPAGNMLEVDGIKFSLKQFHFHSPSENQINGVNYPLEAHFVHADPSGNLAVIGVLFEAGTKNEFLTDIFSHAPASKDGKSMLTTPFDPGKLLPKDTAYFRFAGSLTTPPCSEGVRWLVMKQPLQAGKAELDAFSKLMHHHTNRPVQPVNARPVLH